ncbi:MAG: NADH-quinone oxidoreductase subunit L [Chthoniobacterales bacterium]
MTQTFPFIILFLPLIMAAAILFLGRKSKSLSAALAIGGAGLACLLSWWLFAQPPATDTLSIEWIDLGKILGADSPVQFVAHIGVTIDWLSKLMLVLVTTIATIVFTYSIGYMAEEEGYSRYFAGLSLFLFSMLGIVLADNFVMMFIFWELVGVSSYILIGHFYRRDAAAEACKQAFTVNRIGDFGFMLGILIFWLLTGSVVFSEVEDSILNGGAAMGWLTAAGILVFCGTIGKSAQMPLHVWLPNSMEGPTPVSSLLHAATMVAAGVYLLARIFSILVAIPGALEVIGWVGGITCFVAGLMGIQQDDIKRILAYSTISQLGYMVLGIAVAPTPSESMFHLITHACFKCLLFLCAGSVIMGMHHEQNIWKMGALKNKLPFTFICMVIGGLALMGFPFITSGFYSKDLIIEWAWESGPGWFWLAAGGVIITALYTTRLLWVVFMGSPRSEAAKRAHESPIIMIVPLILLAIPSIVLGFPPIQKIFLSVEHPHHVPFWVPILLMAFVLIGIVLTILVYRGSPAKDPIRIPLFENRFYIDDVYAWIVRWVQDGTAKASAFFDRWVLDGVGVGMSSKLTWAFGFTLRFLQLGNIQAYAFFFGAGVIALIYFLIVVP